jgi:hypothetical protein
MGEGEGAEKEKREGSGTMGVRKGGWEKMELEERVKGRKNES